MDHEKLPSTIIQAPSQPVAYAEANKADYRQPTAWLDSNLGNTLTAAFLVIKNDTVVYERYFEPYTRKTLLPSFSVAKSFVSTLVGIALAEGKIASASEPLTNYIPELKQRDPRFEQITLQYLLDMRSGLHWNEDGYGLKDDAVKLVFRPNMMKHILKIKIEKAPGGEMEYQSINTMLLGIVVQRATHQSLPVYLQEKLWQPLGMESIATWNKDKRGLTIAYAALNAVARDFAKLGSLFLHRGNFAGRQLVAESWVNSSVSKDSLFTYDGYRNQWWGMSDYRSFSDSAEAVTYQKSHQPGAEIRAYTDKQFHKGWYIKVPSPNFFAEGILGQFVFVSPEKNMVIVRLGHNWSHPNLYATDLFKLVLERF